MPIDDLQAAYDRLELAVPPPVVKRVTESTNSDALALATSGALDWTVVVAEEQTHGRGRLDRTWNAKPGDGLLFSVILRVPSSVSLDNLGWVPLMAGLAATEVIRSFGVQCDLKWPNDLVVEGIRKLGGILTEADGSAIVVGVGINVTTGADDLPTPIATSLSIEGAAELDRADLLAKIICEFKVRWDAWCRVNGDAEAAELLAEYRAVCSTLGRAVRVELPGRDPVVGEAQDIDSQGHLIVERTDNGLLETIAAGDVVHVR